MNPWRQVRDISELKRRLIDESVAILRSATPWTNRDRYRMPTQGDCAVNCRSRRLFPLINRDTLLIATVNSGTMEPVSLGVRVARLGRTEELDNGHS